MSYIRTKDGIYGPLKDNDFILEKGTFFGNPIINKADTIEELCDEFVLMSELEKRIIKPKELNKDCEGWTKEIGIPEGLIKVYGAIWTENGLIYIAKMNDEGELCLI